MEDVGRTSDTSPLPFERFFAEHLEVTLAVIVALRGPRVAAEELAQEAFERAYRNWDELRAMERPDLWVQRVALNLATSQLRRLAAEARAVRRFGARRPASTEAPEFQDAERFWRCGSEVRVGVGVAEDGEPYRIQLRRPLLPVRP